MDSSEKHRTEATRGNRAVLAGAVSVLLAGAGWFAWSHFGLHTAVVDAVGEALGVAFGLLVFVSAVGAVVSSRRQR